MEEIGPVVFLATAHLLALTSPKDAFHQAALNITAQLSQRPPKLVTTRAILDEVGDVLSAEEVRSRGLALLKQLEANSRLQIMPLSNALYDQGLKLFETRMDKDWGITDCMSFVVMQEYNIRDALTSDRHFAQAGFRALSRNTKTKLEE